MKYLNLNIKFLFFLLPLVAQEVALARPEYAIQSHINQCTACHISPTGGGLRNLHGKLYGSHTLKIAKLNTNDYWAFDVRAQLGHAKRGATVAKGFLLMNSIGSAQVPVATEGAGAPFRLVGSFNFGMMGAGLREVFILVDPVITNAEATTETKMLVGKFPAPFGLATDEHRTYTKVMVNSTNREFESGLQFSADPTFQFHYDLALVNGFQNDGTPVIHPNPWGAIGNIRYMPNSQNGFLGASHSQHGNTNLKKPLMANSLYGGIATNSLFPGTFTAEAVTATGWNNPTYNTGSGIAGAGIDYFIPAVETAWRQALVDSTSLGIVTSLNYDINPKLSLLYRLEEFIPDTKFKGDFFHRDGVGFRKILSTQSQMIFRIDQGKLNRPGVSTDGLKSTGQNIFILLHYWM
jgi:hypothetical protein